MARRHRDPEPDPLGHDCGICALSHWDGDAGVLRCQVERGGVADQPRAAVLAWRAATKMDAEGFPVGAIEPCPAWLDGAAESRARAG